MRTLVSFAEVYRSDLPTDSTLAGDWGLPGQDALARALAPISAAVLRGPSERCLAAVRA